MINDSVITHTIEAIPNNSEAKIKIDYYRAKKVGFMLRALNHKLRQNIIAFLEEGGKKTVTEIYIRLHLNQSVASQQLSILRKAGILNTKRNGRCVYYSINYRRMQEINQLLQHAMPIS